MSTTTYIPKNTEVFFVSASDFLSAAEGTWMAERFQSALESDRYADKEDKAEALEGWYWWTCCPGCLPDSEASGPFESEAEAIEDAGGGEYGEALIALAEDLGCEPSEIGEESNDYFGLTIFSYDSAEYAVGTDDEADAAWDQALDSYIEDCLQPEIDRLELGSLCHYLKFDEEMWKRDARMDGRGHALASYDGDETELANGFVAFRIN